MFKVYSEDEIARIQNPIRNAKKVVEVASWVKKTIVDEVSGIHTSDLKATLLELPEGAPALDFRLDTVLGKVYARFEAVRDEKQIIGKYTFLLEQNDMQNELMLTPVFAMLFTQTGNVQLGDTLRGDSDSRGFNQKGDDFGWDLMCNILYAIYDNMEQVESNLGIDMHSLALPPNKNK